MKANLTTITDMLYVQVRVLMHDQVEPMETLNGVGPLRSVALLGYVGNGLWFMKTVCLHAGHG